jgi:hypothetical protein
MMLSVLLDSGPERDGVALSVLCPDMISAQTRSAPVTRKTVVNPAIQARGRLFPDHALNSALFSLIRLAAAISKTPKQELPGNSAQVA